MCLTEFFLRKCDIEFIFLKQKVYMVKVLHINQVLVAN
ncbi:hypothetical protein SAMN05421820_107196 [Pedobacter steynii]|uniref:Uncharacterized protein n=1 Tax=Pedobacter steynii TaxID=430522 RepID=A0A1H0AUA6_9SPHI|nr:hypothetical protein SAMN05421820_107196 [Pedobacter steynii]